MIIYGTKAKKIFVENIKEKCPDCGIENQTEFYIFQKYAHVFWIPFFPVGKTAVSQCNHCKKVMKLNEMPSTFKAVYQENSKVRAPFWMFIGAAIIGLIIISAIYDDYEKSNNSKEYIQDLHTNDLLEMKLEGGEGYTYYKITEINNDTILFLRNKQVSITQTGLDKIGISQNNFMENEDLFTTKKEVNEKFSSGNILNVVRR